MKTEYDFSQGERGKFFRPNATFHLPTNQAPRHPGPIHRPNHPTATPVYSHLYEPELAVAHG